MYYVASSDRVINERVIGGDVEEGTVVVNFKDTAQTFSWRDWGKSGE